MASINRITIVGRVGQNPKNVYSKDGVSIVVFSVATSDKWKDKATGEWKEDVQWHKVCCKNPTLNEKIESSVTKGLQVYVQGKLRSRTDKDDKEVFEIIIDKYNGTVIFGFDAPKQDKDYKAAQEQLTFNYPAHFSGNNDDLNEEIPF